MAEREKRHAELAERYLPDDRLARFCERAARYDEENSFFQEDFDELRACGYLTLLVPQEQGGAGVSINQAARLQQRLAGAAPATALGVNMHLLCLAVARVMAARGDHSVDYVFDEAVAGEVFAFGISEPANDWVLQGSTTTAARKDDGGYLLSGTKIFTSLSPVWTRLLVHGLDSSDPEQPQVVYGFLPRGPQACNVGEWDVMGMRATHSRVTVLANAPLAADRVARRIPAGDNPDLLTFAIAANFQLLIGSVYAGIARRAMVLAVEGLRQRKSARRGVPLSEVAGHRVHVADTLRDFQAVAAQLDLYTRDLDECTDHGEAWALLLVSARINASTAARRAVETAMTCAGGASYGRRSELARLQRDATASLFHPPSSDAARARFEKALFDEQ